MANQVKTIRQPGVTLDGTQGTLEVPLVTLSDEYGNPVQLAGLLEQFMALQRRQLAVSRAILANMQSGRLEFGPAPAPVSIEEDFIDGNEGAPTVL